MSRLSPGSTSKWIDDAVAVACQHVPVDAVVRDVEAAATNHFATGASDQSRTSVQRGPNQAPGLGVPESQPRFAVRLGLQLGPCVRCRREGRARWVHLGCVGALLVISALPSFGSKSDGCRTCEGSHHAAVAARFAPVEWSLCAAIGRMVRQAGVARRGRCDRASNGCRSVGGAGLRRPAAALFIVAGKPTECFGRWRWTVRRSWAAAVASTLVVVLASALLAACARATGPERAHGLCVEW